MQKDTVFSHAGFRDGDFITYKTIIDGYSGPQGPQLAQRVIALLDHFSNSQ